MIELISTAYMPIQSVNNELTAVSKHITLSISRAIVSLREIKFSNNVNWKQMETISNTQTSSNHRLCWRGCLVTSSTAPTDEAPALVSCRLMFLTISMDLESLSSRLTRAMTSFLSSSSSGCWVGCPLQLSLVKRIFNEVAMPAGRRGQEDDLKSAMRVPSQHAAMSPELRTGGDQNLTTTRLQFARQGE